MKNQKVYRFEMEWAGKTLSVEKGRLANQATSALRVQYGDNVVLATVVRSAYAKTGINWFPLMVDYEEKLYAAGKIKGSRFIKREGKATDEAVLNGRMIDRSIRPLFNEKDRNEIQVVLSILSIDGQSAPSITALIAASFALELSPIDWKGPIAGVNIGRIDGKLVVSPTTEDRSKGDLDLVVAGNGKTVIMIEAGAKEVSEKDMFEAIELAKENIKPLIDFIARIKKELPAEEAVVIEDDSAEMTEAAKVMDEYLKINIDKYLFDEALENKLKRKQQVEQLKTALLEHLESKELDAEEIGKAMSKIDGYVDDAVTRAILEREQRVDGRKITELREIGAEVNVLPRTHGTGLFDRGQTQVLTVATLGAPGEVQYLDGMEETGTKRYMHHYNFPPFSVGEAGFMRGPGRRDIGHGALAEKALEPVLPSKEDFPYTIRLVSETLSSNGSSSMGAVCGSTLALMDAGVPIKKPVAGIAIGLASYPDMSKWRVLTDIQDLEDGKGGMDFKIAGTKDGITAIQLDTKTLGLNEEIVKEALEKGLKARLEILEVMKGAIAEPRAELSPYAPRIVSFKINPDKIREVIGSGGKVINQIIAETGVTIDIDDDGTVNIACADAQGLEAAVKWVKDIVREVEPGELFQGKVVRIMDFGAFVEVLPGQDGLVHISELAHHRVDKVEDVVKIGDIIPVKVLEIDKMGRINLSLKATLPKPDRAPERREERRDDNRTKNNYNNKR